MIACPQYHTLDVIQSYPLMSEDVKIIDLNSLYECACVLSGTFTHIVCFHNYYFYFTYIAVFCWVNNRYFHICYSIYILSFYIEI